MDFPPMFTVMLTSASRSSPPHPSQSKCHPQTIEVVKTRANGLGLIAEMIDESMLSTGDLKFGNDVCGVLLQYPATDGTIDDYKVRTFSECVN